MVPNKFFVHRVEICCKYTRALLFLFSGFKCKECGFNCHEKCLSRVPQACRYYRNLKEQNDNVPSTSSKSLHEVLLQQLIITTRELVENLLVDILVIFVEQYM